MRINLINISIKWQAFFKTEVIQSEICRKSVTFTTHTGTVCLTRAEYEQWSRIRRQCTCRHLQFFHSGSGPVIPRPASFSPILVCRRVHRLCRDLAVNPESVAVRLVRGQRVFLHQCRQIPRYMMTRTPAGRRSNQVVAERDFMEFRQVSGL